MSKKFPQVYLDVSIGTKPAGRVVFELFTDLTPKTAENFRGLCTGEYGNVGLGARTKRLHYLSTSFHRIVDGFVIQGGDIINGDGTGGRSIYGPTFADENFHRRHACAGLLSMANRGRNTNSSQFFITLKPCPHLDDKHVVFGQVIEGMEVVRLISKTPVDMNDRPKIPIKIVDCGEIDDARNFLRYDPFQKSMFDEIEQQKKVLEQKRKQELEDHLNKLKGDGIAGAQASSGAGKGNGDKGEEEAENEDDTIHGESTLPATKMMSKEQLEKVMEIKRKINEARKLNNKAVVEEERKSNDQNYEKNLKKEKWSEKNKLYQEELELKGIEKDKTYMNQAASKAETLLHKKKRNETFGWDIFNQESLYRAYKKRCGDMPHYKELYEKQKDGGKVDVPESDERLQALVDDIQKQEEKRKKFSRRRTFYEDEDVSHINERNRIFNKKLERHFGDYASEIKSNLERGTAL